LHNIRASSALSQCRELKYQEKIRKIYRLSTDFPFFAATLYYIKFTIPLRGRHAGLASRQRLIEPSAPA
jgi:hypothetical protein